MDILELEGMEFWARHGCLGHEKACGNLFTVDFRAEMDMGAAAASDRLEDAMDYSMIYDAIAEVMNGTHADLLEHLAGQIADRISVSFPQLHRFSVRVSKHRPPVNGVAAWSRVTLKYPRE